MRKPKAQTKWHIMPYADFPYNPLSWERGEGWTLNKLPVRTGTKQAALAAYAELFDGQETDFVIWPAKPSRVTQAERYTNNTQQTWTIENHKESETCTQSAQQAKP